MANTVKISEPLYRGVTYLFTYQHTNVDGDNEPLTGHTLRFTVKRTEYDDNASDTTAIGNTVTQTPGEMTDAAAGYTEWEYTIPATGVAPGKVYFDVVLENDTGVLPPSMLGTFKISGKTTNRS